jgi:hypothetical protein
MSKIKQIATTPYEDRDGTIRTHLFALCEDGSLWVKDNPSDDSETEWAPVEALPGREPTMAMAVVQTDPCVKVERGPIGGL